MFYLSINKPTVFIIELRGVSQSWENVPVDPYHTVRTGHILGE
jgi:hypothetical protein